MIETAIDGEKQMIKVLKGIRVEGVWMTGSRRWDNVVAFTAGEFRFYFWADDFGSLREAFKAARDMKAGKSPEEFQPLVIARSVSSNYSYIVSPEYVLEVQ